MARIIKTINTLPQDPLGRLATYNGFDVLSLFEILEGIQSELTPNKQATYEFEMELQAALLEMEFNGVPVDQPTRTRLVKKTEATRAKIENYLHQLCSAIGYYDYYKEVACLRYSERTGLDSICLPRTWAEWLDLPLNIRKEWKQLDPLALEEFQKSLKSTDKPFNANSTAQKLTLLYHFFGSPRNAEDFSLDSPIGQLFRTTTPPWLKTKGIPTYKSRKTTKEYSPGTDRDCLEKIQKRANTVDASDASWWAQPFISCCLAIADYTKQLGFLNCKLENGWFRSSFGSVTETGRLNSKANHQGFGWNAQNINPDLRVILTTPLGTKIGACDYEQIESRNVAAICYSLFGATSYYNATNSGDLHSLACSLVWPDLGWPAEFTLDYLEKYGPPFPPEIIKAAKQIAKQEFYRGKSRRDVSKTLGHGSNYLGQPPHMAKQSHIPLELVKRYQDVYFSVFPEIQMWHNWTIEQVQVEQELTTIIFNRTRQFFSRPSDDATIREAVAYVPQSMAADYTNRALLTLHKQSLQGELPITLFLQKHDEIGFRFAEQDQDLVIPQVLHTMEQTYTLTAPNGETKQWSVPVEALVGWNLGYASKSNPDGLVEWPDNRTRKENPFNVRSIKL